MFGASHDDDGLLWLDGGPVPSSSSSSLRAPYDDRVLADVHQADPAHLDRALATATRLQPTMAALPRHRRRAILDGIARGIATRKGEFVDVIVHEAGKPRSFALGEVERAVATFAAAAAVLLAPDETLLPLDASPLGEGRLALVRQVPRGVVVAITPFNFPLNLVAHKLAPAFAAGCAVVLKPAEQTPLSSLLLARICRDAGLPDGALSVVPCDRRIASQLVTDPRAAVVSFTGSAKVGWALRAAVGRRHALLELGGDASVIVHDDADLDLAVPRIITGAFAYAGQVCISVQHILVHRRRAEALRERLVAATSAVTCGDPDRDDVVVGPLIDDRAMARVGGLIDEASAGGGRVLVTPTTTARVMSPALVEGAPAGCALMTDEAFGPVCTLDVYDDLDDAIARVNASRYGLQAGIFSSDVQAVLRASETLQVGAVIHDDVPTFRVDHMPYGGTKDSGVGREGLPWALTDYTEPRTLVLRRR
jgi:aldehyde dehydrogenase (NAD+)/glyceraldehyde-3-phosphate dehydrogenase (NADP+)